MFARRFSAIDFPVRDFPVREFAGFGWSRRCLVVAVLVLSAPASLRAVDSQAPSSPSAQALSESIWFDAEQDSLKPVKVKPQVDDSLNRDSRWLPNPDRVPVADKSAAGGGGNAGGGTGGGNGLFGSGLTLGNVFGWVILILLVVLVIAAIAYALSKSEFDLVSGPAARAGKRSEGPDQQTLERIKHLPPELRRTDVNLRDEAERLMSEKEFDQAIILLFAHQLLLLDRAGLLRLNRGKTNRRYVRETRSVDRDSATWLQATVHAFERSYFGRHAITEEEFSELWSDNQSLEQTVRRRQEVAA